MIFSLGAFSYGIYGQHLPLCKLKSKIIRTITVLIFRAYTLQKYALALTRVRLR